MPWSTEWVVRIATDGGRKLLGTGTLIAPGRVLTARHVVDDARDVEVPGLVARREHGESFVPVDVAWRGAGGLDVAVLNAAVGGPVPSHPLAVLSARAIEADESWEAQGYPAVRAEAPSSRLVKVGGRARSCGVTESDLWLDAPTHPGAWGGLSGAGVVLGHHVAGVVRGVPLGWKDERISATPVAAFLQDAGFREALGLNEEDERLVADLEALRRKVEDRLRRSPDINAALAEVLSVVASVPSVACALLQTSGKIVAQVFDDLDRCMEKERAAVRGLFAEILPFAVDWHGALLQARAAVPIDGAGSIELSLRTQTVAEIVLAGVDGRCCQFAPAFPDSPMPEGVAHERLPATTYAPIYETNESVLVEAVVMNLGAQGTPLAKTFSSLRGAYVGEELKRLVNVELEECARRPYRGAPHPRYLLFIDAVVGDHRKRDTNEFWAIVRSALGRELPKLRLVRLQGGERQMTEEGKVARHIRSVRDRIP